MSTRTAIFQEQEDGTFKGIYIQSDGYIEGCGVGATLNKYWNDYGKVKQLIDQEKMLSALGTEPVIETDDYNTFDQLERLEDGSFKNCLYRHEDTEYYTAETIEEIIEETYKTHDITGHEVGYTDELGEFNPFYGSDNNGYWYYQTLDGIWRVIYYKEHDDWNSCKKTDELLADACITEQKKYEERLANY